MALLGSRGREPRRYGFPFLYEKIITSGRNGKTCNKARMSYGCGPEGREALSPKAKPRSRCEWHSRLARILGRIAAWCERPTRRPRHRVHRLLCRCLVFSIPVNIYRSNSIFSQLRPCNVILIFFITSNTMASLSTQ